MWMNKTWKGDKSVIPNLKAHHKSFHADVFITQRIFHKLLLMEIWKTQKNRQKMFQYFWSWRGRGLFRINRIYWEEKKKNWRKVIGSAVEDAFGGLQNSPKKKLHAEFIDKCWTWLKLKIHPNAPKKWYQFLTKMFKQTWKKNERFKPSKPRMCFSCPPCWRVECTFAFSHITS